MSREDPKPGRWVLPLVVAGLIGFTYVFVNALPAAEVASPGTTTTSPTTTSTTAAPATSTTLNPAVAAFIETTNTIDRNVSDLATLAQQINDDWDTRDEDFGATRDALEELEAQTITLADDTAALEAPPALDDWDAVLAGMEAMREAAAGMIDGLVNASGSEPRLTALEDYKAAAATVSNSLRLVRREVRNPGA